MHPGLWMPWDGKAPPGSRRDRSGAGWPFRGARGAGATGGAQWPQPARPPAPLRLSAAPLRKVWEKPGSEKPELRWTPDKGANVLAFGLAPGRPALRPRAGNGGKDLFKDAQARPAEEKPFLLPLPARGCPRPKPARSCRSPGTGGQSKGPSALPSGVGLSGAEQG